MDRMAKMFKNARMARKSKKARMAAECFIGSHGVFVQRGTREKTKRENGSSAKVETDGSSIRRIY